MKLIQSKRGVSKSAILPVIPLVVLLFIYLVFAFLNYEPSSGDGTTISDINIEQQQTPTTMGKQCPASCDDNNPCTEDSCASVTNFDCIHEITAPCCGNNECETGENSGSCAVDCQSIEEANTPPEPITQPEPGELKLISNVRCVDGFVSLTLANLDEKEAELRRFKFYISNMLNNNPDCDKDVLLPGETTACTNLNNIALKGNRMALVLYPGMRESVVVNCG